jgi:PhzF family phenazine biosynthesis protein
MAVRIFQVDAFTDEPFKGNPAGVCLLPGPHDPAWMQKVAKEMNLSETAFLYREANGYSLRWFTPAVEVDLCGHATLASAHILWEEDFLTRKEQARFQTRSGLLSAEYRQGVIELNLPAKPEESATPPTGLLEALGIKARYIGSNKMDYLVEVESEEIVRNLTPDFPWLKTLPNRAVAVTSRASSPNFDFVSRFFAPKVGVDEDPVTGSSHCMLGPFWGKKLGKNELAAYQASERGGTLRVRLAGDRVVLGGRAVTVLRGELVG